MKRKFIFLLGLFLVASRVLLGKGNEAELKSYQDSLRSISPGIYERGKPDEEKRAANTRFLKTLEAALRLEHSFDFDFDSLTDIGRLKSPDGTFKIYNWNLPKADGTHEYYGFIQRINPKTNKTDLFQLYDKSDEIRNPESQALDAQKWFGALYYTIIPVKSGKTTYYTLLGWDGNNNLSWKKLIEVLYFDKDGKPKFGESIFEMGKFPKKRIIFEFRAEMIMALRYDAGRKMIIFDNLVPEAEGGKGIYETYVMDGSYNGLQFKKGKWVYQEAINALNPKDKKDDSYIKPTPVGAKPDKTSPVLWDPHKKKKAAQGTTDGQK